MPPTNFFPKYPKSWELQQDEERRGGRDGDRKARRGGAGLRIKMEERESAERGERSVVEKNERVSNEEGETKEKIDG